MDTNAVRLTALLEYFWPSVSSIKVVDQSLEQTSLYAYGYY